MNRALITKTAHNAFTTTNLQQLLTNADIIARTEYVLAGRFATIRSVAELAGEPVTAS
jgi:hypothetical protein